MSGVEQGSGSQESFEYEEAMLWSDLTAIFRSQDALAYPLWVNRGMFAFAAGWRPGRNKAHRKVQIGSSVGYEGNEVMFIKLYVSSQLLECDIVNGHINVIGITDEQGYEICAAIRSALSETTFSPQASELYALKFLDAYLDKGGAATLLPSDLYAEYPELYKNYPELEANIIEAARQE